MYAGTFGSKPSIDIKNRLSFLHPRYLGLSKKKPIPLKDLLFMFGVFGSLYTLVLAERFIF